MKPFSTIAIPHKDILEGRLTMDVFAADLWEVFKKRAQEEYQDPTIFFRKTYITDGLKNLLNIAEKRLKGEGGDPIIQLQTPFGGGKTHSLIALYHKTKEWGAKAVVIDGTALDPKEITIWEEIERQLTGKIEKLKGRTSPGREKLRELLDVHQPLLILMDEILEYTTKASGIKVGDSNLASQVLAFIQELTGTVKSLEKSFLILTLPSSVLEHYDENAERLFQQLQKITGRMEKVYTPVHDEEIDYVIKRRLFSSIDEKEVRKVIEEFLDYADKERIFPEGVEKSNYRERFIKSYPFQPEIVDILYKRWGSFPTFQRTRGVLRLLSLVVYSLKDTQKPFIRLGDFNLKNDEIKRELIKHIGPEYDSIIAQDLTSRDAGAKKVDRNLGDAYAPFSFGSVAATTIFLYSFSGGPERGATISEVKLSSVDLSSPSSIVVEAVSKLKENLFYISDEGLFFTNQPNLNRILLIKMEGIVDLEPEEKDLLTGTLTKEYFDIFLWPNNSKDIADTNRLKLVIQRNRDRCKEFLENCGERPRVYRNTLIFLCPLESERINFESFLKKKLAWQLIEKDRTLHITDEQKKEIRYRAKKTEMEAKDRIRGLYRTVLLPSRDDFKEIDLGIPTYGAEITIDKEIYERLRNEGEILERLAPLSLKEKYLKDRDYVETKNILESLFKTPGEIRVISDEVLKDCIKGGIKQGLFGVGDIENEKPICRHFKDEFSPEIVDGEILIKAESCLPKTEEGISDEELQLYIKKIWQGQTIESLNKVTEEISSYNLSTSQREIIEGEIKRKRDELAGVPPPPHREKYQEINLKLNVPAGKLSDIVRMVPYLKSKFNQVKVKVEISAQEGEITISDYEDKIMETINQSNIIVEDENLL
ncbi:AAA family ATPase [Candidatus Atribacteria bacterium HGW-Atribacteria-1]|nr:MAG: AAA family ATPase [Candidatus Atribacteria bacterium HGW-Atribacteria-1]